MSPARRSRTSNLFPLLLLLALAAASLWLERAVQSPDYDRSGKTRHDPDFVAEEFNVIKMGTSGKPEYNLSAARMLHYPDDDSTDILAPRLVQRLENAVPIVIRADRGLISRNGEEASFSGNVVVVREAGQGRSELRVQTEYLQIVPDRDLARTDRPVIITEGRSRLAGVGMEINNKTRNFALLSQVRGTFDAGK
ncbi:MAG: LPS export ABC transporter periplasmic protein LptC [Betaproteobacteria bacterium]|nr:MAG: LPS export ABC transporter periplasmic protein LptC [Betaproteobacteria bacterium]